MHTLKLYTIIIIVVVVVVVVVVVTIIIIIIIIIVFLHSSLSVPCVRWYLWNTLLADRLVFASRQLALCLQTNAASTTTYERQHITLWITVDPW